MIDWRTDTEKRLNNLLNFIVKDVTNRGDARALSDNPRVMRNADGSFTVIVLASEDPSMSKSVSNKKPSSKLSKSKDDDDDDGDSE